MASHGSLSSIMEAMETIYGHIHNNEELYPSSRVQEKTPKMAHYFDRVITFKTHRDFLPDEHFYHTDSEGLIREAKEDCGLIAGFSPVDPPPPTDEPVADYSFYYGQVERRDGKTPHRLVVCV